MDSSSCTSPSVANIPETSANNTLNPFEADSVDSLHLTQFSPSVFAKSATTPSSSKSTKFRWSIDHLAILHPADIDEHHIQQESTLDSDTEERAQLAIEQFFSQQHVVPSPWSVKRPIKHVTFSPNPPTITEAEDSISIVEAPACSAEDNGCCGKQQDRSEVSCQTTVTLPVDFDLLSVLGEQFTFQDRQADDVSELGSSSLRRKLFSHGEVSPTVSPVQGGLALQPSPERISDIPSPQVSPIRQIDDTTLSASDISHVKTPGSVQSQFSSSPISSKMTPRRWTPYGQGSRASSGLIASPTFSPISSTIYPTVFDSCYPSCDSSDMGKAPPCDVMLPDASPILADTSQSQVGMISPFLASMEPSSVEMMPMSFSVSENHSACGENDAACASTNDVESFTSLPLNDRSFISDSIDRSDCRDSGESESSSPVAASMCSMEQSYFTESSKRSDDSPLAHQQSDGSDIKDADEDMMNTRGDSLCVYDDMLFNERTNIPGITSDKQRTSTLRLPSLVPSDSVINAVPTSSKAMSILVDAACLTQKLENAKRSINAKSTVVIETVKSNPRSKVLHHELVTLMQSDSGFNTQSFTSMEVTDNDGIDCTQSHEYSVDDYPMGDKENIGRWKAN